MHIHETITGLESASDGVRTGRVEHIRTRGGDFGICSTVLHLPSARYVRIDSPVVLISRANKNSGPIFRR